MNDLIRREDVIKLVNQFVFGLCKEQNDEVKRTFNKYIEKIPIAYDIDKVVYELENLKDGYDHSCLDDAYERGAEAGAKWIKKKAIEIVKRSSAADDVCEWKSTQINNEWKPSCEPNSTYNVFGVAWFKKCPYCGKKIKVVE